jgi:hypothetical protein
METGFKKRQVEGSFQRFRDHVSYVLGSDILTFPTFFNNLIVFCETDEVLKIIISQLKEIDISADDWMSQLSGYGNGILKFHLPSDEMKRTALLYKICLKIFNKEIEVFNFSLTFDNSLNANDTIGFFNNNILRPFVDSIGYKIDDISYMINEDYQGQPIIPLAVFNVYYDNSVKVGNNNEFSAEAIIGRGANIEKK